MAEEVGFEPTRRLITDLSVFKTELFGLLSIPPYKSNSRAELPLHCWRQHVSVHI